MSDEREPGERRAGGVRFNVKYAENGTRECFSFLFSTDIITVYIFSFGQRESPVSIHVFCKWIRKYNRGSSIFFSQGRVRVY